MGPGNSQQECSALCSLWNFNDRQEANARGDQVEREAIQQALHLTTHEPKPATADGAEIRGSGGNVAPGLGRAADLRLPAGSLKSAQWLRVPSFEAETDSGCHPEES